MSDPIFRPDADAKLVSDIKPRAGDPRAKAAARMQARLLAPAMNVKAAALNREIAARQAELRRLKGR